MENEKILTTDVVVIPKRSIWSILGLVVALIFTYFQFIAYLGPGLIKINELRVENIKVQDIGLMWAPIILYFLISLNICLAVNIYKKLTNINKAGLIDGFLSGLVIGPIIGIILSFILCMIIFCIKLLFFNSTFTIELLVSSIVRDLSLGYLAGFVLAYIIGFFGGLYNEFNKKP